MFKKILIAEDHEVINLSVQRTVKELEIPVADQVFYCDDALEKVKKSLRENDPYDLIITDLHYDEDHHQQNLKDGKEMIAAIKKIQPGVKVIFFSAEHKSGVIDSLFNHLKIDGFVRKGRNDAKELKKAITMVAQGEKYLSLDIKHDLKELNSYEFTSYDITLISLLAQGVFLKNIPIYLQNNNIKPNSLSSVEKKLTGLREGLKINNNEQLVAFCKDLGLI
ncbi:response regulator [Chryseobacterium caseinilyticum]|uniref:Response regulator transcription factor n=1 Tax=Chryseobacterium caseinilyticum TaxID=2771428 RepID=A0ABR8ZB36_9FLAO|nr:response regulator [Chryseobacterium caseinilyticum]MBD8082120.1 response regulator transcription factor [Chryseobacterium caseinilyticum]